MAKGREILTGWRDGAARAWTALSDSARRGVRRVSEGHAARRSARGNAHGVPGAPPWNGSQGHPHPEEAAPDPSMDLFEDTERNPYSPVRAPSEFDDDEVTQILAPRRAHARRPRARGAGGARPAPGSGRPSLPRRLPRLPRRHRQPRRRRHPLLGRQAVRLHRAGPDRRARRDQLLALRLGGVAHAGDPGPRALRDGGPGDQPHLRLRRHAAGRVRHRVARGGPLRPHPAQADRGGAGGRGPRVLRSPRHLLQGHRARRLAQPGGRRLRAGRLDHHAAGGQAVPRGREVAPAQGQGGDLRPPARAHLQQEGDLRRLSQPHLPRQQRLRRARGRPPLLLQEAGGARRRRDGDHRGAGPGAVLLLAGRAPGAGRGAPQRDPRPHEPLWLPDRRRLGDLAEEAAPAPPLPRRVRRPPPLLRRARAPLHHQEVRLRRAHEARPARGDGGRSGGRRDRLRERRLRRAQAGQAPGLARLRGIPGRGPAARAVPPALARALRRGPAGLGPPLPRAGRGGRCRQGRDPDRRQPLRAAAGQRALGLALVAQGRHERSHDHRAQPRAQGR